jgi:hypothetical protein
MTGIFLRAFLHPIRHSVSPLLLLVALPTGCAKEIFAQSKEDSLESTATTVSSSLTQPSSSSKPPLGVSEEPPTTAASAVVHNDTPLEGAVDNPRHTKEPNAPTETLCREQPPQDFLVQSHINRAPKNRAELAEQRRLRSDSIAYRTRHYGHVKGFGSAEGNSLSPRAMSAPTTFFTIPIVLNRRIIPALKCVEERLKSDCASTPYSPRILSGLRHKNTYFDGEVSNHVYGIAIDIDPAKNPCCKCVAPWNTSERCQGERTAWERMSMPRCWVEVFERFGFYWLGHDVLEDTMHFEFLGDPDRILR